MASLRTLWNSLTTRGSAFVASGICLLLAGFLLGQRDLARIGLLLLLLTAGALWFGRSRGLALEVSRTAAPPTAQIGEPVVITVRVTNPATSSSPVLLCEEQLGFVLGDRPRFVLPALDPGGRCEVQYVVRSPIRGAHQLGPLGTRVRDIFGLSLRLADVGQSAELLVVPRPVPLHASPPGSTGLGEDTGSAAILALHGDNEQGIREYRQGDDLRRIHWPASARTGDLMVRQEDRPIRRQALVLLDTRESAHSGMGVSSTIEWAVVMAASVCAHLQNVGYSVQALTAAGGGEVTVSEDLPSTLVALAKARPTPAESLEELLHAARGLSRRGGLVIFIGGALAEGAARSLAGLRQPGSAGLAFLAAAPGSASAHGNGGLEILRVSGVRARTYDRTLPPADAWATVLDAAVGAPS